MASGNPFRIGPFQLTPEEVNRRKDFLQITDEDERLLREAHPHLSWHVEKIVDEFYDHLLAHEETREILGAPGLIEKLRRVQSRYFLELTWGRYDIQYFENRLRVGLAHERAGISPDLYLGAYSKYIEIVSKLLPKSFGSDRERSTRTLNALRKIIHLDMGLAIDAYHNSALERLSQKSAEIERANEELKKVSAEKKQITDMIVHDLQNPLASIMAVFELLGAKAETFSEQDRVWLQKGMTRCGDLSQLILNVVQVSRAEEGKLELQLEDVNASDVVRKSVEAFDLLAEQGGRLLKLEHNDADPVMLRTDEGLLRRILDNLVRNALRHTPAGTEVNIRVQNGPTSIAVCDNGPGIPPELQSKIFEPFTSRSVQGMGLDSGLGLSFCRLAAEALGLDLRLDSTLGEGACFVIEVPER